MDREDTYWCYSCATELDNAKNVSIIECCHRNDEWTNEKCYVLDDVNPTELQQHYHIVYKYRNEMNDTEHDPKDNTQNTNDNETKKSTLH